MNWSMRKKYNGGMAATNAAIPVAGRAKRYFSLGLQNALKPLGP